MPVLPGSPPLEIVLKRSARARRFSLRVSRLDGRVTLSLPARAREAEAMAFARSQEGWLRETLAGMPSREGVGIGSVVPVEGRLLRLVPGTGRAVRVEGDTLLIPGDPAQAGARAGAFLKALARERLVAASDRYAAMIGRRVVRVTLRDTRSRWGSCAADGALMYSWRLVMAPPAVLDYVAAHEVAHMVEMNHSDRFWAVVERLYPGWQAQRKWLHMEGQALHAFRFGDRFSPVAGAWLRIMPITPRQTDPNAAAHERLYRTLRQQVMHGELPPGQAMTLRGLGKQFGVSMTPAREAVRRLVAEGALTLSSSGRISTPELTPERIEELAAIRAMLEPEMAARALPRAHFALIERLAAINALNAEAVVKQDAVAYVRTNLEFHRTLYLRAQAPAMLAICETVWLQLGPTMRALYSKLRRKEPPQHHRMILAALKAGDEPGLRLAVRTDVTQGLRHLAG